MRRAISLRFGPAIADALLAALVLFTVGLMVLPLPTWVLDVLWTAELGGALLLLSLTLLVASPLALPSFPSLLLLTTLFRLGVSIASTRAILSQADAGAVVQSFGSLVMRGNPAVGFLVFALLCVVQFVVIGKGAERIAEVGARFTLDALPGKQLGIEAQQRLGSLSTERARLARGRLEAESQFYGAMDGAMKFVKGDALAGVIITVVNLLGGVAIGMLSRGLPVREAVAIYGVLAVGAGFISQLAALVITTAAGLLVTRAASEDSPTPLGTQLFVQFLGRPAPLALAATFIAALAIVPGFPALPFIIVATLLALGAVFGRHRVAGLRARTAARTATGNDSFVPVLRQWEIRVAPDLAPWLGEAWPKGATPLPELAERIRTQFFERLGVPLSVCSVRVDERLGAGLLELHLREVPEPGVSVPPPAERGAWLERFVGSALEREATHLLGMPQTLELLDRLRQVSPAVVEHTMRDQRGVPRLTSVLQELVGEGVSVRDLSSILEALSRHENEIDVALLVGAARRALGRAVSFELIANGSELPVVTLSPEIEDSVREALVRATNGTTLVLAPSVRRDLIQAIGTATQGFGERPIILASPDVRFHVRRLVSAEIPTARVVCAEELGSGVHVRRVAEATLQSLS